ERWDPRHLRRPFRAARRIRPPGALRGDGQRPARRPLPGHHCRHLVRRAGPARPPRPRPRPPLPRPRPQRGGVDPRPAASRRHLPAADRRLLRGAGMSIRERLRQIGPYTILLEVLPVAALVQPGFYRPANLQNVVRDAAFLAIVALGQLIVIIGRGLDLSVGGVITTASLLMVYFAGTASGSLGLGLASVIGVTLAIGLLNGLMVAFRRVPAILATLGTLFLVEGVSLWLTGGRSRGRVPEALVAVGAVAVAVGLHRTTYGRALFATGLNPEASALSGIPTRSVVASTYVIAALVAALSGLMLSGLVGFYDRTLGVGYDLDSIAAVV